MKGLIRSLARGKPASQAIRKQRVKLTAKPIVVSGASGVGFGTTVIGDLPEGNILFLGAMSYLQVTKLASATGVQDTFDGDYSIGTTPTVDATLSGTDINLITSSAFGAAVAGVSPVVRGVGGTAGVLLDNTDGALEINLNLIIDDANISADTQNLTVTGVVELVYVMLLDD